LTLVLKVFSTASSVSLIVPVPALAITMFKFADTLQRSTQFLTASRCVTSSTSAETFAPYRSHASHTLAKRSALRPQINKLAAPFWA
jgi:hypothetical protein